MYRASKPFVWCWRRFIIEGLTGCFATKPMSLVRRQSLFCGIHCAAGTNGNALGVAPEDRFSSSQDPAKGCPPSGFIQPDRLPSREIVLLVRCVDASEELPAMPPHAYARQYLIQKAATKRKQDPIEVRIGGAFRKASREPPWREGEVCVRSC
jgi:hypothetical protein